MRFQIVEGSESPSREADVALRVDKWNDFGFVTQFGVSARTGDETFTWLGPVKIGFSGQTRETPTVTELQQGVTQGTAFFGTLPDHFVSLGTDAAYYQNVHALGTDWSSAYLDALRDIASDRVRLNRFTTEPVVRMSLLRNISPLTVRDQFRRILDGGVAVDDYSFSYTTTSGVRLDFAVRAGSTPPTNIHVLIGRNGVGKTHTLKNMADAFRTGSPHYGTFADALNIGSQTFANAVILTFSPFEEIRPEGSAEPDPTRSCVYVDLGHRVPGHSGPQSPNSGPGANFVAAFEECVRYEPRKARWRQAIATLESDPVFASLGLPALLEQNDRYDAETLFASLSSGHKFVLLAITALVNLVAERTLVLLDEPESHLHPPLLGSMIRALSDLMTERNGVAVVATHSPVVLQEAPADCVWVLSTDGTQIAKRERPTVETFGEGVGVLTREVFGLEVAQSGFHRMVADAVESADSYEELLAHFDNKLGSEARAIALGLLAQVERDV